MLDPDRPVYAPHPTTAPPDPRVREQYLAIEHALRLTQVHRAHPGYVAPEDLASRVVALIG